MTFDKVKEIIIDTLKELPNLHTVESVVKYIDEHPAA